MGTSQAMNTSNDKIKYKITVTQNSQDITNNTSNVTVSVRFYRTNTGYTSYGTGTVYCKINGTQYSEAVTTADKITSSGIVLFTKTLNISHNSDGTKTLATSAWINHDVVTSSEQSYPQTLTTIPRATTPTLSASSVDMGSTVTISMSRASSSFTHTLTYAFEGTTGTIGTGLGTSKAWEVPMSLATQIPNAISGTCTITCNTYNGNTLVGTKTVALTVKVPSSVVPVISSVVVTEGVSGLDAMFHMYIQNNSKFHVVITAGGINGATIKTYSTTINGMTYSGSIFTSGTITKSGTVAITTTVTDSRGRKSSSTTNVSVHTYSAPKITSFTAFRSNSSGVQTYDGQYITVKAKFSISMLNDLNLKSHSFEYKAKSASTWTSLGSGSVYSYNSQITFATTVSTDSSFDIRLVVEDYFGSATAYAEIPTAFTLMDLHSGGKGIAFGKVCEMSEAMEVALPMYSEHGELISSPIVIPSGTDLNTLKTTGYYVFSNANSPTLVNCPIGGSASGSIQIISEGEGTQVRQIVTRCSDTYREVWERLFYANSWKAWMRVFNGVGKVLWTGVYNMSGSQTVNLSEAISEQVNGIILVFSRYSSNTAQNYHWNHFFVHKAFVNMHSGQGSQFLMSTDGSFSVMCSKYIYISDTRLTGGSSNNQSGTANGITYNNAGFVLRYVIGV